MPPSASASAVHPARRRLLALFVLLTGLALLYISLPRSWFEIPEDAAEGQEAALVSLAKAAKERSLDFVARSRYGMALEQAGRSQEALEEFQAAVRLAPESPEARHNLGVYYLNHGDLRKAEEAFLRELELSPGNGLAHHFLGLVAQGKGRFAEAAHQFEMATRLAPAFPDSYLALATQLAEKRPPARIIEWVDTYLRLGGVNRALAFHVASRAYRAVKEYDKAIEYAERADREQPNVYAFVRNLGQLYSYRRRFDDADRTLHRALTLTRNPAPVYIELGVNAQTAGRYEQAVEHLRKALELSPETGNVHIYLARVYQQMGKHAEAAEEEAAFRAWELAKVNAGTAPPPRKAQ